MFVAAFGDFDLLDPYNKAVKVRDTERLFKREALGKGIWVGDDGGGEELPRTALKGTVGTDLVGL